MSSRRFIICTLVAVSSAALPAIGFAACDARSGLKTAALVELYTSEGCSSCPPADRQLHRLRQVLVLAAEVVPPVLHPAWNRARLEVVAFVQDERTGGVLQPVSAYRYAGS